MIITIYRPDGTKERRPVGYTGGACHAATEPYERREVPGSVTKTATADACNVPVAGEIEKLKQGG